MSQTDCRSPEGVTVGLVDSIITSARVLRGRDLSAPAVIEALRDLRADEDVAALLAGGRGPDVIMGQGGDPPPSQLHEAFASPCLACA
jgi:hypothetical protein